jgi:putative membrane protein insertion efficiency factor
MRGLVLGLIRSYQLALSPLLPPACRFSPSCSQYSFEAVARYGLWKGGGLAIRRLLRCHPFHPGGYDPVPLESNADTTEEVSVSYVE